jgi:hypothetical protein
MDMLYHWLIDRVRQKNLMCIGGQGVRILATITQNIIYITQQDISFQLAPPHIHHRNAAARAIQTLKDHFIAGLSSCDPNFPLKLWDKLLPQATFHNTQSTAQIMDQPTHVCL